MIPARFSVEYPRRCMELLEIVEPTARDRGLVGSVSLLVASSLVVIPYERMKRHPLHEGQREPKLYAEIRDLRRQMFLEAHFWQGARMAQWRLSRIVTRADNTLDWRAPDGKHPLKPDAANQIEKCSADGAVRVIRNALAHGNIVYLNEDGFEERGTLTHYLAFLSRYEESEQQRQQSETYRVLITTEQGFLEFVKAWARWLESMPQDFLLAAA